MGILKQKIKGLQFDDDEFVKAIAISPETMVESLMTQPSLYWKFGKIVAYAQKVASDASDRVDYLEREAKLLLAQVETRLANGEVKMTDKVRLATAQSDVDYIAALDEIQDAKKVSAEAEYEANLMQFVERCMRQRADLLKSLAFLEAGGMRSEDNEVFGAREKLQTQDSVDRLEKEVRDKFEKKGE